jgi:hypothetical protein
LDPDPQPNEKIYANPNPNQTEERERKQEISGDSFSSSFSASFATEEQIFSINWREKNTRQPLIPSSINELQQRTVSK